MPRTQVGSRTSFATPSYPADAYSTMQGAALAGEPFRVLNRRPGTLHTTLCLPHAPSPRKRVKGERPRTHPLGWAAAIIPRELIVIVRGDYALTTQQIPGDVRPAEPRGDMEGCHPLRPAGGQGVPPYLQYDVCQFT